MRRGDLQLPDWGPYSKAYAGVSHLPDPAGGMRFDLSVFPGFHRRRQILPNLNTDSGAYMWRATPGLETYRYRHALDNLDSLYVDITYTAHLGGRLIQARFVNRTPQPQQLCLHYLASIHFPEIGPGHQPPLRPAHVSLPDGAVWIDGTSHVGLTLDEDSPARHLPASASLRGETRASGCVHGSALGGGFGSRPGERAVFALPEGFIPAGTVLMIRYRLPHGEEARLQVSGAYEGHCVLTGNGAFQFATVTPGRPQSRTFQLEPQPGPPLVIDGCALVPRDLVDRVEICTPPLDYHPNLVHAEVSRTLTLEYAAIPGAYALAWEAEHGEVRTWISDRLDHDFAFYTHEHVRQVIDTGGERHYTNVFVRPVFLAPGETRELPGFVCHAATREDALARLDDWRSGASTPPAEPRFFLPAHTASGRPHACGVERLAAVLATNVVYPVRRFGHYIRHYTPGRWWDSFYTWDSGFIGLGLLELDPARSAENLACYLTEPDEDSAFVHHGSPVPVQIYQLQSLWNRTRDPALLRRFFPGARRMHRFLAGRSEGSRTRTLASGIIRTWDYFYNSGGWDDYPPQKHIRGTALTASITPVVNTAHAIRTARILREFAVILAEPADEFDADITALGAALQQHAWNPASGWYSYVRHDDNGRPLGPLLHASGEDYNRGFDGISPLIAGICTPEQEALFLQRLRDPKVLWTDCGLSTVDQSAPYFSPDGYWNGAVWMPHQWFFWKALLDLGEGGLAWQIARTALETWSREVQITGCCFEHFLTRTGRGAGWHQFGGLSSPILSWFCAYYRPGSITTGFDALVLDHRAEHTGLQARLRLSGRRGKTPVVIVVQPGATRATWKGRPVPTREIHAGTFEVNLPNGDDEGNLVMPCGGV